MAAPMGLFLRYYKNAGEKLYRSPRRFCRYRQETQKANFVRCSSGTSFLQKNVFKKVRYTVPTPTGQRKDTVNPLPSAYSPEFVEAAWYDWWVQQGFFSLDIDQISGNDDVFVLLLPPPNVTGTLHIGHALTNSVQDAFVRWHRMRGHRTVWVPGCDHAGIATQVAVEKALWNEQQKTRHQLGREQFVTQVWKWKESQTRRIGEQMKRLGSSFDWSRNFFTLDKGLSKAVTEAFVRLHESGKIYRDTQLVDSVAVSGRTRRSVPGYEDPVEFGVLSSFAYPVEGSDEEIIVSTTRLETMLGDTAVAVHPDDPRYSQLIGRKVQHPLCQRSLPIIADSFVDRDFGSGAVKITPGHDPVDLQVGHRHGLPQLNILDDQGNICGPVGQQFAGLKRFIARDRVRAVLTDMGLFRGEVEHRMVLPVCSRSGDIIEHRLKEQWFVSCQEMAQRAVQAVLSGQLKLTPPHHEAVWFEWLNNVRDWCVSRQLWWGHRIPAYKFQTDKKPVWVAARSEGEAIFKFNQQFPEEAYICSEQDEDVLDTWFSSALLPFSVFGWPDDRAEFGQLYPLSMMETGHDILFFWVARMVMLGLQLTDSLPFHHVLLHGIVRDAHGRKMSKSLGNIIDPVDIIQGASVQELHSRLTKGQLSEEEKELSLQGQRADFPQGIPECGADALRFTLCSYDFQGEEIRLNVLHARTNRLFCNKIWQAFRFIQQRLPAHFTPSPTFRLSGGESAMDMWILSRLSELVAECDAAFSSYNLHHATRVLHRYWLTEFCDIYLECCKGVFSLGHAEQQEAAHQILYHCVHSFLRALAPFMPFLSEELYQRLPMKVGMPESICLASYPQPADYPWHDTGVEQEMAYVQTICHHILSICHHYNITKSAIPVYIVEKDGASACRLQEYRTAISQLAKADPVHIITSFAEPLAPGYATAVINGTCSVYVQFTGHIDVSVELKRLSSKQYKLMQSQRRIQAKLTDLINKGKSELALTHKLREKEKSLTADLETVTAALENMKNVQKNLH